jgi:folate-binding protein YgfZ
VTVPAFVVDRSPRGLIVARGDDATSFLQSLVSQDLGPLGDGDHAPSLPLTPQGKLDVAFRILRTGDEWWLDTDADYAPRLLASLTRFRIRVTVDLEDRTPTTGLVSTVGVPIGTVPDDVHTLPTDWAGHSGVDLLGPVDAVRAVSATLDPTVERWTPERFEAFRIEAGVPRLGVDLDDRTIPQEAFLERDAVSFTKGCFVGQELVCRIDTRGHVNRYLRGVHIPGGPTPPRGATVVVDGADRGTLTSVAAVPGETRAVGLAMVRREVEPPTPAQLRWDTGQVDAELVTVGDR